VITYQRNYYPLWLSAINLRFFRGFMSKIPASKFQKQQILIHKPGFSLLHPTVWHILTSGGQSAASQFIG
jgi:hypothetical protein